MDVEPFITLYEKEYGSFTSLENKYKNTHPLAKLVKN
jgi:hypothetical protein